MKRVFELVLFAAAVISTAACSALGPGGMDAYNAGVVHQQKHESTLAEQQFKIALQENPELAEAHLNLGLIYLESNWIDGAEEHTRQAIQIFERTKKTYVEGATYQESLSLAYNNLGMVEMQRALEAEAAGSLASARNHWRTGMDDLNKAVDLDRTDAKAQSNLRRFKDAYR